MKQRRFAYTCGVLSVTAVALSMGAGAGADALVFFEVAPTEGEDVDVYGQRVTVDGELPWGDAESPTQVGASAQREGSPSACTDGAGGAIVVYELTFLEGEHVGDVDIVAQRVNGDGELLWNDGERPQPVGSTKGMETRPVAVSDGAGGAIVVYEWLGDGDDTDILAQRIDASGEAMWNEGETPSVVAASDYAERRPVVVSDGAGGVVVVFEWVGDDGNTDVMAQRVASDGTAIWNDGTVAVDISATTHAERNHSAVADGAGGVLVAFELEFLDGKYKGDVDVVAQRVSADGARLWNGGEEPVLVSTGAGIERRPAAASDDAGGIIVVFEYEPLEGEHAGDIDVLAQRVSGGGELLWNDGERASVVSTSAQLERQVLALPDGRGGALLVYEQEFRAGEHGGDIDVTAQRISEDGELLWEDGERSKLVAGSEWLERAPLAVPDGERGLIVFMWAIGAEGKYEGDEDILAARVSRSGELLWHEGEKSVPVAGSQLLERKPCVVTVR